VSSPPGTYLPPGASEPIADPGGTYSGYNATAPTEDPAGTYSSPYALNRLFLDTTQITPATSVQSFDSVTAVENYYGVTSLQASWALEFFAGYAGISATMMITRIDLGDRPHLLGANISRLTLTQLQSINGSLSLTFDGYAYSGQVNLAGVTSFADAATDIRTALNSNRQIAAITTESSITPETVTFTGYAIGAQLFVTSVQSGHLVVGGVVSGPGIIPGNNNIIYQHSGTPGGAGEYAFFANVGSTPSETMTETYGVLTVGDVTSGTVAVGQAVDGPGIPTHTAIDGNLSGSGAGSTWIVNNAQTFTGDTKMRAAPLSVENQFEEGATENNDFFEIQPNGDYGFDPNPSSLSYVSGTAAAALGLTLASGAIDSSPGGQHPSVAKFMDNLLQNETNQFGSFQPYVDSAQTRLLAAWALSDAGLGYQDLMGDPVPAGSSEPVIDLPGTYSGPGASAPTPDPPGSLLPLPSGISDDVVANGEYQGDMSSFLLMHASGASSDFVMSHPHLDTLAAAAVGHGPGSD
jgi:hypothetical protein